MRATLANALTAPAGNPAVTIMLDQSMNAQEGGKTRLANVAAALDAQVQAMPPTAAVGLWTFDGVEGRSEVATGPLSDPVDGKPRSAALTAALDGQTASGGGAVSFTTLRMIYDDALAKFRQGQTNSVLVITAGPHTDQSLDGGGLQDYVRRTFDPAKPVAINVIDFGGDPDRAAWEAVAQISGGGYQNLSTSASPDLATAITTFRRLARQPIATAPAYFASFSRPARPVRRQRRAGCPVGRAHRSGSASAAGRHRSSASPGTRCS